jgi:hypothetical protein
MRNFAPLLFCLFCLSACTFVHGDTHVTVGKAKVEHCTEDESECIRAESEGVSAEFATILKALFGWWPW